MLQKSSILETFYKILNTISQSVLQVAWILRMQDLKR